jgi:hypothetical protein
MVLCGSSKTKSNPNSKKPTAAPEIERKPISIQETPQPDLKRQKSFYGPSEDIYPIKVDFICTDRSNEVGVAKKHRFVVLTDSALILYDEAAHP